MKLYQPELSVFSEWLEDIGVVQDELLLSSNTNVDRAKSSSHIKKTKGFTFATSEQLQRVTFRRTNERLL